jgi:hypothetical protein
MSVAIALRRAGHSVTIYEKSDFAGEVGASVSCAANGTRWLHEWKVDVAKGDPVILKKLINRDWKTGEPVSVYDLADYEQRWGYVYNMFHRQYMHEMLKDSALEESGEGKPAKLVVNYKVSGELYCQCFLLTFAISAKISTWKLEKSPLRMASQPSMISSSAQMESAQQSGVPWEFAQRSGPRSKAAFIPMSPLKRP